MKGIKKIVIGVLFSSALILSNNGLSYASNDISIRETQISVIKVLMDLPEKDRTYDLVLYDITDFYNKNFKDSKLDHTELSKALRDGALKLKDPVVYKEYKGVKASLEVELDTSKVYLIKDAEGFINPFVIITPLGLEDKGAPLYLKKDTPPKEEDKPPHGEVVVPIPDKPTPEKPDKPDEPKPEKPEEPDKPKPEKPEPNKPTPKPEPKDKESKFKDTSLKTGAENLLYETNPYVLVTVGGLIVAAIAIKAISSYRKKKGSR